MKRLLRRIAAARYNSKKKTTDLLLGKYEIGKLLGHGAFANVYHARNVDSGESVAIKAVSKNRIIRSGHTDNIKREISILRRVRHPNVIHLHEVLATKGKIFFIMDFARGGEILSHVKRGGRFGESLCRRYFRQLIFAVGHCHRLGVFHRDIKPENLLLDGDWNLRVSDFGLSAVSIGAKNKVLQTVCGTPAYVAPEILSRKGYGGAAADVWSCGVVLFVMAAGYHPFNDVSTIFMYQKINKGEFRCPKWFSPDLKHLISRMLDTNPETRITITEIYEDPWFIEGESDLEVEDNAGTEPGIHCGVGNEGEPEIERYVNAFDIISAAGFDLSGLFINSGAVQDAAVVEPEEDNALVSRGQGAEKIIEMVKKATEEVAEVKEMRKE